MGVLNAYIVHTSSVNGEVTTIYDFTSLTVRRQINAKTTAVDIRLPNRFGKYNGLSSNPLNGFREEDTIQIYVSRTIVNEENDLLINITVKEYEFTSDEGGLSLKIIGMDKTYQLLSKIYLGGIFSSSDGLSAPEAIKKIVDWVSETENRNSGINTNTEIQTAPTKKDSDPAGTATFKDVSLSLDNKNAYEWVQQLSRSPHTDYTIGGTTYSSDRSYIFYVNKDDEFVWTYPSQDEPSGSNVLDTETSNVISATFKKSIFDVVNMVIYKAGEDPNGTEIQWYYYYEGTKQPDLRVKNHPMTDIARDLQEQQKKIATFNGEFPASYDFTTSWGETVSSDDEYVGSVIGGSNKQGTGFRGEVRRIADARAKRIAEESGDLKWKGNIQLRGSINYTPGELMTITHRSANLIEQKLRCKSVSHAIGSNGWVTTIELEEDSIPVEGA